MQEEFETTPPNISTNDYTAVIIGTGPIGLLAALATLADKQNTETGPKVAILADRFNELGVRQQVLWVKDDVFEFIQSLVGDQLIAHYFTDHSIVKDPEEGYYFTTGALELLCFDALTMQYNAGVDFDLFYAKKIDRSNMDDLKIDTENASLQFQSHGCNETQHPHLTTTETLSFKYLIAADGAKRTIARAIGKDKVFFDETQTPLSHTKHVVATLQLPEKQTPQTCMAEKSFAITPEQQKAVCTLPSSARIPCSLTNLKEEYGWSGHTRPHSQVYTSNDIIYIGAEMPSEITDRQVAKKYAIELMHDWFPTDFVDGLSDISCDLSVAFGKKREALSVSMFDIELGELNVSAIPCGGLAQQETAAVVFFMGDAKKNPLYTTGTGVQTGIREVRNYSEFLKNQHTMSLENNLSHYHDETRAVLLPIMDTQDQWVESRKSKEQSAKTNFEQFQHCKKDISTLQQAYNSLKHLTEDPDHDLPVFINTLCSDLMELHRNHTEIFSCAIDNNKVLCYNLLNMPAFIAALKIIQEKHPLNFLLQRHAATIDAISPGVIKQTVKSALHLYQLASNNIAQTEGILIDLGTKKQEKIEDLDEKENFHPNKR